MTAQPVALGLISDTHLPDRLRTLPPAVFEALDGVDLILHAGDVGALTVLDQLSAIAPVIAVHGNDDSEEAIRELPRQQVLSAAGHRLLLTHSHYPDRAEELAMRRIDDWPPKLARLAGWAKAAGASILVYGHTHVPMNVMFEGVRLVNPGAIAAGNYLSRQIVQTVARMPLTPGQAVPVEHVNLAHPHEPFSWHVDLEAGFMAAGARVSAPLLAPDLDAHREWFLSEIYPLAPELILRALRTAMFHCLDNAHDQITIRDVLAAVRQTGGMPGEVIERLEERWPEASPAPGT